MIVPPKDKKPHDVESKGRIKKKSKKKRKKFRDEKDVESLLMRGK